MTDVCSDLKGLAGLLDDVIGGATDTVVDVTGGLLGGLGLGGVGALVGGVLDSVSKLLLSVLGLVNNLVNGVVGKACGLVDDVLKSTDLVQADVNALAKINLCFNPSLLLLINKTTGAAVQLTLKEAQALVNLVNQLAAATSPQCQAQINGNFAVAN